MKIAGKHPRQQLSLLSLGNNRLRIYHNFENRVRFSSNPYEVLQKQYSEYLKSVLKKFMFQVHPDYFFNHKQIQAINNQNLRLLQAIFNHEKPEVSESSAMRLKADARSLTFYVKPNDLWPEPKKVKVTTSRVLESIIEVLETIGIEPPEQPVDFAEMQRLLQGVTGRTVWSSSRTMDAEDSFIDSETMRILEFLESIGDRKELIALREERTRILQQTEKELLRLTDLNKVEYWNSWSAYNNRLLLSNILHFLEDHRDQLDLPWTGLSLVIAKDDAGSLDVDYIEKTIRIDCSNIAAHWIHTFQKITTQHLHTMKEIHEKIQEVEKKVHQILSLWIDQERIVLEKSSSSSSASDLNKKTLPQVQVVITKGFTCTRRRYADFLGRIYNQVNEDLLHSQDIIPQLSQDLPISSSSSSSPLIPPITIHCIIEDSHGTKLLPNGNLRIDYLANSHQIQQLIHQNLLLAIRQTKQQRIREEDISSLEKRLCSLLQLASLERGRGIDEDQYHIALKNIDQYLRRKNHFPSNYDYSHSGSKYQSKNRGILKNLSGIKLMIGHYHGVRDDGYCLLPWNFRIHQIL